MYQCSRERMEEKIKTFSKIGDAGHGGITRYSLSEEALEARREFVRRMEAIGAEITTDDMPGIFHLLRHNFLPSIPDYKLLPYPYTSVRSAGYL